MCVFICESYMVFVSPGMLLVRLVWAYSHTHFCALFICVTGTWNPPIADYSKDDAHQQREVPAGSSHAGKGKINNRNPRTLCKPWHRRFTEHSTKSLSGETTPLLRSKETPTVSTLFNSIAHIVNSWHVTVLHFQHSLTPWTSRSDAWWGYFGLQLWRAGSPSAS